MDTLRPGTLGVPDSRGRRRACAALSLLLLSSVAAGLAQSGPGGAKGEIDAQPTPMGSHEAVASGTSA
ncbi:MAG: hypothetical protein QGG21_05480, partial [Candidatus Thalassarchaeaceae archaeon]|nr:hypothetical protein [Candidatus Thalassarchaeaceae archaeon]